MNLYPLKFVPITKERLWGGEKLKTVLEKYAYSDKIGESWEISGVEGDISIVSEGALKGTTLCSLIETHHKNLLGKSVVQRFGKKFPVLIKFIDAKKDLSIQVHPNDALAKERHNSLGKTEMWHVIHAEPKARLIIGFNKSVTKQEYKKHLHQGTLTDILNTEMVSRGDTFFINAGVIHAIGADVLLAEIQQTSDITYRVYDFNRKDESGNLRELHTEMATNAIDYNQKDDFKITYTKKQNTPNTMVQSPYFSTNYLQLTDNFKHNLQDRDSFTIYICIEGNGLLSNKEGKTSFKKGETLLLAAKSHWVNIKTKGATLLEVFIDEPFV